MGAPTAGRISSGRQCLDGSRPSGNKINDNGRKSVSAQVQPVLVTVATSRHHGSARSAAGTQAKAAMPAAVEA